MAAALAEADTRLAMVPDLVPETWGGPLPYRVFVAASILQAEVLGTRRRGTELGLGTARSLWASRLGTGRREAGDGPAWDAAMEDALARATLVGLGPTVYYDCGQREARTAACGFFGRHDGRDVAVAEWGYQAPSAPPGASVAVIVPSPDPDVDPVGRVIWAAWTADGMGLEVSA